MLERQIRDGDIVFTKSLLAFDEDLVCRRCGHIFTLTEGNWEGKHPKYNQVKAIGLCCPNCKNVNVAYYKTKKLMALEEKIRKAPSYQQKRKRQGKYQREFLRVQKRYGGLDV